MNQVVLEHQNFGHEMVRTSMSPPSRRYKCEVYKCEISLGTEHVESDKAPTNKIYRRASSEQRPRTRFCHESERLV